MSSVEVGSRLVAVSRKMIRFLRETFDEIAKGVSVII